MTALLALLWFAPVARAVDPAPSPVTLVSMDGLGKMLKEPPGKIRVVNFWATWCGPCVSELPTLRDWAAAHAEVDVVLVNVDTKSLHAKKVVPFVQEHGLVALNNVQLDHADPALALRAVVPDWPDTIPVTQVYGADGVLAARYTHAVTATDLDQAVRAAK